jgi:hypothetical protein
VRNALAGQLPRREPRALEHRPRLVHPDEGLPSRLDGASHDAERGAVAGRREPAGVAVREDPRPDRDQLRAVGAQAPVRRDVLLEDGLRLADQPGAELGRRQRGVALRVPPHPVERPEQVHGGRPGLREPGDRGLEVGEEGVPVTRRARQACERDAERGRDTDRRGAAHRQRANRVRHLGPDAAVEVHLLPGETPLVQEDQPIPLPADRKEGERGRAH